VREAQRGPRAQGAPPCKQTLAANLPHSSTPPGLGRPLCAPLID
jgi:hypothetical protein